MAALVVARAEHDPSVDWAGFTATAWRELSVAMGWREREEWPAHLGWSPEDAQPM